jgi:hypothetical protein
MGHLAEAQLLRCIDASFVNRRTVGFGPVPNDDRGRFHEPFPLNPVQIYSKPDESEMVRPNTNNLSQKALTTHLSFWQNVLDLGLPSSVAIAEQDCVAPFSVRARLP